MDRTSEYGSEDASSSLARGTITTFYIKIETNLNCLLTLKQNKKVVFNNINKLC